MRVNELKGFCTTVGATNLVLARDKLINVSIDALLAEALSAVVALTRVDHDVLA